MKRFFGISFFLFAVVLAVVPAARAEFGYYYAVRRISLEMPAGSGGDFVRQHVFRFENQRECMEFARSEQARSEPPRRVVLADCIADAGDWDALFAGRSAGRWYIGWDDGVKPRTVMTVDRDFFKSDREVEENLKAMAFALVARAARKNRRIDVWVFGPDREVPLDLPGEVRGVLTRKR